MVEKNDRILVTGAHGFLGRNLCELLRLRGHENIATFRSSEFDLRRETDVKRLFDERGPFDVIVHLAAMVGGIKFRKENPGKLLYDNVMMNTLTQEYALRNGVSKFIGLGSIVAYAHDAAMPFNEEDYLKDEPEETNRAYAIAKRLMFQQGTMYRKQSGFNSIHLIMTNMYGTGFDINSQELYVIPSLIKRFDEAREFGSTEVVVWGSGRAFREFLYVDDASEAIILAMERYNSPEPLNIGSGVEHSIREIAGKISALSGFDGKIEWDESKPEGKLRNLSNTSRANKLIGFRARTTLEEGLKKTIEWYKKEKDKMKYSEPI